MDLIPLPYRLAIGAFFVALAGLALFAYGHRQYAKGEASGRTAVQAQFDAFKAKAAQEASEQQARNLDLQREAEKHYTVQGEIRDRFIVQTVTEVRHETDNLAACVLTADARRLLNDAAACAGQDRPASCGTDKPVRGAP